MSYEKVFSKKLLAVFGAVLMGVTGFFSGQNINDKTDLYICESQDYISDCINGVKANGARCYYDADNARKYKVCREGWDKKSVKNILTSMGLNETLSEYPTYICDPWGCY